MPIIEATILEGNLDREKEQFMKEVTLAAVNSLKAPADAVRVIIREVPRSHMAVAGVPKSEASAPKSKQT